MAFQGDSIYWVEVGKIVANPFQPRKEFNEDKLKELSESIRMYGILQPLTVTRKEIQSDDGAFYTEYELIAGERRLRASKLAGLEQVPVIIRSGEDTEQEKLELAIIENLQREDLNAVDRALAFRQLADVFKLSHSQVAKKVGRSRMYVSNTLRLLGLPDCILNSVALGDISEGHARTLLMLKERPEEQDVVYREILLKKLSVREVERIARKIATDKVRKKQWNDTDAHLIAIEKEFTDTLGTRVQIAKTDFGGKVTIDYFSEDDLHKLLTLMQQQTAQNNAKKDELAQSNENQTVIQEMSPEASLLAKVAAATPLEAVDDEVSMELNTDEVSSTVDILAMPEEPAEVAPQSPEVPAQPEETVSELESVPENVAPEIEIVPENVAPEMEVPLEDAEPNRFTSENFLKAEEERTHDVDTSTTPPTVAEESEQPITPVDLNSEEFAFINNHPEEARKEDVQAPTELEKTLFRGEPSPTGLLNSVEKDPLESELLAETAAKELTQAVADKSVPDSEDDDLYSMKNFSL